MRVKPKNHYLFVCFVSIRYLTKIFIQNFWKKLTFYNSKISLIRTFIAPLKFELERLYCIMLHKLGSKISYMDGIFTVGINPQSSRNNMTILKRNQVQFRMNSLSSIGQNSLPSHIKSSENIISKQVENIP